MEWENVRKEEEEVIFYISKSKYFITLINKCGIDIVKKLKLHI